MRPRERGLGLTRWFALIGVLVGFGCLQVAQRNAVILSGYAVGTLAHQLHEQATQVSSLRTRVAGLHSPAHLAQVARTRGLELVAWSTIDHAASPASMMQVASTPNDTSD